MTSVRGFFLVGLQVSLAERVGAPNVVVQLSMVPMAWADGKEKESATEMLHASSLIEQTLHKYVMEWTVRQCKLSIATWITQSCEYTRPYMHHSNMFNDRNGQEEFRALQFMHGLVFMTLPRHLVRLPEPPQKFNRNI